MKFNPSSILAVLSLFLLAGTYSCQQPGVGVEKTGSEFIPDMATPVTYEANLYTNYSLNSWDEESVVSRHKLSQPRLPVKGTIPRGYASIATHDGTYQSAQEAIAHTMAKQKKDGGIVFTPNGSGPYYYPDTEEGRTLATEQIRYNPFPITKKAIANGQELYTIYCSNCHGDKGDGEGYLVAKGGKYPAQPANFLLEDFINSSNGRYYHAIMYGKNAMGSHADKLSYEERWNVIHYIRLLQAKSLKVKYNDEMNELNPEYGVPAAQVPKATTTPDEGQSNNETSTSGSGGHGH